MCWRERACVWITHEKARLRINSVATETSEPWRLPSAARSFLCLLDGIPSSSLSFSVCFGLICGRTRKQGKQHVLLSCVVLFVCGACVNVSIVQIFAPQHKVAGLWPSWLRRRSCKPKITSSTLVWPSLEIFFFFLVAAIAVFFFSFFPTNQQTANKNKIPQKLVREIDR